MTHDVIAIGASAGGVEVLLDLVSELPESIPAAIFVVLHTSPTYASQLPELMSAKGRIPATHPLHGDKIEPGQIYVASADSQLLVRQGFMEVVRGPKENGHRPSVDALFRSASLAYGPRVVGVVLSGYQDCGTAGMMSIKARGGVAVAQSPESAAVPDMPRSVIEKVAVDHVVHPLELPGLLVRLASAGAGPALAPDPAVQQVEGTEPGFPAEVVCPLCQGALTEAHPGSFTHFRCHVGHTFSLECLVEEQGEEMERTLWAAVRALEEGARLSERLSHTGDLEMRRRFVEKSKTQMQQADLIREILLHGRRLDRDDAAAIS